MGTASAVLDNAEVRLSGEILYMLKTEVRFKADDPTIQGLYEKAEATALNNIADFAGRHVLIEGGGYPDIWLETQPMGGEMYAKRIYEKEQLDLGYYAPNSC